MTTTTNLYPEVPAGALEVHGWTTENGVTSRCFWGYNEDFEIEPEPRLAERGYRGAVVVRVAGRQWADGTIRRWGEIEVSGYLTPQDLRTLAVRAAKAADEIESADR